MHERVEFQKQYGPWAVVCGASEGLGAAYAEQLAQRGLNLLLVARRGELLTALARRLCDQYPVEARTLALDLAAADSPSQIYAAADGLEVGLLVYNAALSAVGPFEDRPLEDHLREIDTNVRAPLSLVYQFSQAMLTRGRGGIILMSSLSSFWGSALIANYAATKAYNTILAEGLWEEWRERGVDVLVCIAGATRTPNYVASQPQQSGRFSDATLEPEQVSREALAALGSQAQVIPGRTNRLASFFMRHLFPRTAAVRVMGQILRGMYVKE